MSTSPRSLPSQGRSEITCVDPATGALLGTVSVDSPVSVERAVKDARMAQVEWAKASFAKRREVLRSILAHVLDHADELCRLVARDTGKTLDNAALGEIWPVCEKLRWTIRHGEKHLRDERVSSGLLVHKKAVIEYHPRGVVGVICPWNYPLQNVLGPTIPALMAGNACVVKVSEMVAWCSRRIQEIFDAALIFHGFSPNLVRLVNGYGETGEALCQANVNLLIFTGSRGNGRKVLDAAKEQITPVILELGGKDAMIVCEDAVLDEAVHAAMAGVFIAAGQNCMAAERILVYDAVYDAFLDRVLKLVGNLRQGPPLSGAVIDVGAIVSMAQVETIERLVEDAVQKGATVLAGGRRGHGGQGQFFEPTILADVTDDMAIWQEETFGPVMVVRRVRNDKEAILMANRSVFGLSSSVFSSDAQRAERIARSLHTGSTCVNGFGLTYMAQDLPFGGVKESGFGRLNGREGLRACTNQKAVLYDRLGVHQATVLYPAKRGGYESTQAAIQMMYREGAIGRLKGLQKWVRARRGRGQLSS